MSVEARGTTGPREYDDRDHPDPVPGPRVHVRAVLAPIASALIFLGLWQLLVDGLEIEPYSSVAAGDRGEFVANLGTCSAARCAPARTP